MAPPLAFSCLPRPPSLPVCPPGVRLSHMPAYSLLTTHCTTKYFFNQTKIIYYKTFFFLILGFYLETMILSLLTVGLVRVLHISYLDD